MASTEDTTKATDDTTKVNLQETHGVDADEAQLLSLGYQSSLRRNWRLLESFAASFCALDFIGGVRSVFFLGILAGGPAAIWSSYLITMVFMWMTAAVLAEICSALPLSGSIYIWAAESAGPKYGRLVGFVVAFWTATAWMTFAAGNAQTTANYLVSLLSVYDIDFPGGIDNNNVKWRALIWAVSEGFFAVSISMNFLPSHWYGKVFRITLGVMAVDFILNMVWLPIGVVRSYGFRSTHEAFLTTFNGTGAPPGWNWILSFLFTAGTLTGFDASGHIAEETKNASVIAATGILSSAIATGILSFATVILYLFCTPPIDVWLTLDAPQPFVQIYALAMGKPGAVIMTIIAVVGLVLNTSVAIVAASRLIFAIARDGVLPGSKWIGQVSSDGQPRHAVIVMGVFGSLILCTILPSAVAFTSLISAGGVPTIAAYGLIALLRLTQTPYDFKSSKFGLGKFKIPFYVSAVVFNGLIVAVMVSPFSFPVTAQTLNYAGIILAAVTIFALVSWWVIPEDRWLRPSHIKAILANTEHNPDSFETVTAGSHEE